MLGVAVTLTVTLTLAGCGSGDRATSNPHAHSALESTDCATTVVRTVGSVLERVYREGVSSERAADAKHLIETSTPLRDAVESGDAAGTVLAARALLRTRHMTNLRVVRDGHTLVNLGGAALAPLTGTLTGADGAPIATYTTSVWDDRGFLDEARGVTEGSLALRASGRSVDGSLELPPGSLPSEGTLTRHHVQYRFTSFPAQSYPSGALRVFVLRPARSPAALCGRSSEATLVNTLRHVANLIYAGEAGPRRAEQLRRIESNRALLEAVARRDPAAIRAAIGVLLHQHVVRMRVSDPGGRVLANVGGPYVLAPGRGELRLHGRTIGTVVLSIQDDEGYLRLAKRLAGMRVLMYMNVAHRPTLVKNSLGPEPGVAPASGVYRYRGATFHVFTVNATAFPSGPLTIRVLVPIPYS
jgi:hypothetical protein